MASLSLSLLTLLAGCAMFTSTSTVSGGSSSGSSGGADGSAGAGKTWQVYEQGKRKPTPTTKKAGPAASPKTTPLTLPTISPATPATRTPLCPGRVYEGKINGLTVIPGAGSAAVTWLDAGDTYVVRYRVTAVNQDMVFGEQEPLKWVDVTPNFQCKPLTANLTGLQRNTRYVFWVDAVTTRFWGGTQDIMVNRSVGTRTT